MRDSRASAAGEGHAGTDFGYRLVNQGYGALAVAPFIGCRGDQFAARRLKHRNALDHVRLGTDGIADPHAGSDGCAKKNTAGGKRLHVLSLFGWLKELGVHVASPGANLRPARIPSLTQVDRLGPAGAQSVRIWTAQR